MTFVLVSYNQSRYIEAALESAFSQTYNPLQIIVSDDCSTDGTFEIIESMAADYSGNHELVVRQTIKNLGVIRNVFETCRMASGEIVVIAAGDDVSYSDRCEHHAALYADESVSAVTSHFDLIDAEGKFLSKGNSAPLKADSDSAMPRYFKNFLHPYIVIQGSTASYRRRIFNIHLPSDLTLDFAEDNLLNFMVYASGNRVATLNRDVVGYRMHDTSLGSRRIVHSDTEAEEKGITLYARQQRNMLITFRYLQRVLDPDSIFVNSRAIDMDTSRFELFLNWQKMNLCVRIGALGRAVWRCDFQLARWQVVRLLGDYPLYQPRRFMVLAASLLKKIITFDLRS